MLVGTGGRIRLRPVWIPAFFLSLPFAVLLGECLSRKKGCALDALLKDSVKSVISWLSRPSVPRGISFRWLYTPYTRAPFYQKYGTLEDEERYWKKAESLHAQLLSSDAWYTKSATTTVGKIHEKPIVYYKPQLPPLRRKKMESNVMEKSWISAKAVLKWHWMVFPDRIHPTALQAKRRVGRLSHSDQREIRRIASLVRAVDIKVIAAKSEARQNTRYVRYSEMWRKWLETKENDVIIAFE